MSERDEFKANIVEFFEKKVIKPKTKKEIDKKFSYIKKDEFDAILTELINNGELVKIKGNRYVHPKKLGLILGVYRANEKGYGFVSPIDGGEDYFIGRKRKNNAWDGDTVFIRPMRKKTEAYIEKIVKRANVNVVGQLKVKKKGNGIVFPDKKELNFEIKVDKKNLNDAQNGQKVVVHILKYDPDYPEGEIIEILGNPLDKGVDILSVIVQYNIPRIFPELAVKEANNLKFQEDLTNRKDLRGNTIFTIDGADAKDFDDAVEISIKENGNFLLGVHIADVSHYVQPNSKLDMEAFRRGNSYYFVDRVIPMLPENLSNNLCSLRPNEDKMAFSVYMEINKNGDVVDYDIFKSIIRSVERLNYRQVQDYLFEGKDNIKSDKVKKSLVIMNELREILGEKRKKRGGINFENPEYKVILDGDGIPQDVMLISKWESYNLIEEFMIVANETVAEHLYNMKIPTLYRVHAQPDIKKLRELSDYVKNFGYTLPFSTNINSSHLQKFLEDIEGTPEEVLLNNLLLRSMKRAIYSQQNIGHFGLASRCYTHFTSPIRRYADLIVHRTLNLALEGKFYLFPPDKIESELDKIARQCNSREHLADEVEKICNMMKILEYLENNIGDIYDAVISGVKSFGVFVQLVDFGVEGLVQLKKFSDDFYSFDEENYQVVANHSKRSYRLGDKVRVQIINIDKKRNYLDLEIIEKM